MENKTLDPILDAPDFENLSEKEKEDFLQWRDAKVQSVLDAKQKGEMEYVSFEEVRSEFGFDAR
jgi:hypothetical protein